VHEPAEVSAAKEVIEPVSVAINKYPYSLELEQFFYCCNHRTRNS
jgi:hypothetical protein